MEVLLIILGIVLIVVNVVGVWLVLKRSSKQDGVALIKSDLIELNSRIDGLKDTVYRSNTSMSERLERNSSQAQNTVTKQLAESQKLVADVSRRLANFENTNKQVVNIADDLKTLQNVLQNPKQRGVFGEFYLESVLDNILSVGQYKMQYKFSDGETADAVIFLDKGKILPIDSKFSLENYNRMIEASGEARDHFLARVKADLKGRIDETSKYIRPDEGTMDFAFMFIPSESLYYDLLISNVGTGGSSRDLIEYAFRDKHVIITSPTSFMAYLQTVLQGLRSLQIEEQAKDIQVRVGQLGRHLAKYDEYMKKLGNSLGTTVNHYNSASKEFVKVDKDVVKISGGDAQIEASAVDRPQLD